MRGDQIQTRDEHIPGGLKTNTNEIQIQRNTNTNKIQIQFKEERWISNNPAAETD